MEQAGAEGQARAANVLKAVRMAEDVERAGAAGPASVAARLAERVEAAKEAPGALSAEGGDFVRIMTVHASKGLEFPIVAVAELGQGVGRGDKLLTERVNGAVYASLDLGGSVSGIKDSSLLAKCAKATLGCEDLDEQELAQVVEDRPSAASRHAAIRALQAAGEEQEARRLLYVALTRAKEALVCRFPASAPRTTLRARKASLPTCSRRCAGRKACSRKGGPRSISAAPAPARSNAWI